MKYPVANNKQKGISLIITFFIMIIILSVVISISTILYSEIRIIRNIGNSVVAFYAADGGVEKVLYYDRHVIPTGASRGLCSMCDIVNNADACTETDADSSANCLSCSRAAFDTALTGCDLDKCNDCELSFYTTLESEKSYSVVAKVHPDANSESDFIIDSAGVYKYVKRAIELKMGEGTGTGAVGPVIVRAEAVPRSVPEGLEVEISADIISLNNLKSIIAYVKETLYGTPIQTVGLSYDNGITYIATATNLAEGVYYVNIIVCDVANNCTDSGNIQ